MDTPWKIYKTRNKTLGLVNTGKGCWRFCDLTESHNSAPSVVGPTYRSKVEALADLDRFTREVWGS